MEEDYPFGYTGMRPGPSVERARMAQRRYGVAPSYAYAPYDMRFISGSGESLLGFNTRFIDTAGEVDRFGGFPMESGLLGNSVYTSPQVQSAPTPTPAGQAMRRGVAGRSSLMAPIVERQLAKQAQMLEATQPASMPATPQAPSITAAPQAVSGAPITPRSMEVPTSLGPELPQPTSVAGDVGKFFKSKQGGALLAAGGALLASGLIGGRPDESPITERIKELEGTEQYGRFLDIASRTAPSRADYLGVMAARGGSAVQAEEAAQAAQSRAAREAVSEYNRYRVAADAQAAELRLALQQQREQRRLAKIKGFGAALGAGAGFLLAGPAGSQIGGALGSGAGSILGDLTD